jgi:hypothetical protein
VRECLLAIYVLIDLKRRLHILTRDGCCGTRAVGDDATHRRQLNGVFCDREPGHIVYGELIQEGAAGGTFCVFQGDGELYTCNRWSGAYLWRSRAAQICQPDGAPKAALGQLQLRELSRSTPLCVDPTGTLVVLAPGSGSGSNYLRLLDVAQQHSMVLKGPSASPSCSSLAFQEGICKVVAGYADGQVLVWTADSSAAVQSVDAVQLQGTTGAKITSCAISSNGLLAAAGAADGTLTVWDLTAHEQVHTAKAAEICCCAFSADGTKLAYGTSTGEVWVLPCKVSSSDLNAADARLGHVMCMVTTVHALRRRRGARGGPAFRSSPAAPAPPRPPAAPSPSLASSWHWATATGGSASGTRATHLGRKHWQAGRNSAMAQ